MANRSPAARLTPLELDVMSALWAVKAGTVQTVLDRMPRTPPLAYNTVQTVLGILHRKKHVRRRLVGKAFVYAPVETRERAALRLLREMTDKVFGGSPAELVMTFVRKGNLSRTDLRRLLSIIRKHEHDAH